MERCDGRTRQWPAFLKFRPSPARHPRANQNGFIISTLTIRPNRAITGHEILMNTSGKFVSIFTMLSLQVPSAQKASLNARTPAENTHINVADQSDPRSPAKYNPKGTIPANVCKLMKRANTKQKRALLFLGFFTDTTAEIIISVL